MAALPDAIQAANRDGVNRSALAITNQVRDSIRAATGDMRMSGIGRRGAKVGARYDVKGAANPTALIRATGPVHLLEGGRRGGYEIRPRSRRGAGRRRGGRPPALLINGQFRPSATGGSVSARRVWSRGVDAGIPRGVQAFAEAHHAMMVRNFS